MWISMKVRPKVFCQMNRVSAVELIMMLLSHIVVIEMGTGTGTEIPTVTSVGMKKQLVKHMGWKIVLIVILTVQFLHFVVMML